MLTGRIDDVELYIISNHDPLRLCNLDEVALGQITGVFFRLEF